MKYQNLAVIVILSFKSNCNNKNRDDFELDYEIRNLILFYMH